MSDSPSAGFSTRAIHAGHDPHACDDALVPPVHLSSTFVFETAADGAARFAGESAGHVYSRIGNPTLDLLERRLATLEETEAALATASGMGAITATLWTLLSPGDRLVVDTTLYGCTFGYFRDGLARFGIEVVHADLTDRAQADAAITGAHAPPRAVYFETPANPNMRLVDITAISEMARQVGATTIVDNTYATPYLTRPALLGADLVIHSATKYLGGHGDLVAGLVAGPAETLRAIRMQGLKDMTGAVCAPFNAYLVLRGLKTLALRMERHSTTALALARFLEAHPAVARVHYPGLESFAQYNLAGRQMTRPGGMIAFELTGGMEAVRALMDGLALIRRAVSLGDAETLIQHAASMTHSPYTPEERARFGISDGLVRLSAGLEEPEDLIADLAQALAQSGTP